MGILWLGIFGSVSGFKLTWSSRYDKVKSSWGILTIIVVSIDVYFLISIIFLYVSSSETAICISIKDGTFWGGRVIVICSWFIPLNVAFRSSLIFVLLVGCCFS